MTTATTYGQLRATVIMHDSSGDGILALCQ
jgi:hypothetical protein